MSNNSNEDDIAKGLETRELSTSLSTGEPAGALRRHASLPHRVGAALRFVLRRLATVATAMVLFALLFAVATLIGLLLTIALGVNDGRSFWALVRVVIAEEPDPAKDIVGFLGFGVVSLAICFLGGHGSIREHVTSFGPSVRPPTAVALLLGLPAVAALASWAGKAGSGHFIPAEVSHVVLALVVAGLLSVGWASALAYRTGQWGRSIGATTIGRAIVSTSRVIGDIAAHVVTAADLLLVKFVAVASGATLKTAWQRYTLFMAVFLGACAGAALASHPQCWVFASIAAACPLAIWRRWSWIEEDRVHYLTVRSEEVGAHTGIRIGFGEDLRDEALTALVLMLLVLLPIVIARAHSSFELFTFVDGAEPTVMTWLTFIGGELAKAVPLMDWSEVYGVENGSDVEVDSSSARHLLFAVRVAMDVILIATLIQAIRIGQRLDRQRAQLADPNDPLDVLDPFEERRLLSRCAEDWERVADHEHYSPERLTHLIATKELPEQIRMGAARVSGWQLGMAPLRMLLESSEWDLRRECAEALARRAQKLRRGKQPDPTLDRVMVALGERCQQVSPDLSADLLTVDRRRELELQSMRLASGIRAGSQAAQDVGAQLSQLADLDALIDLTRDDHETRRDAAFRALMLIKPRVDVAHFLRALTDSSESVRHTALYALAWYPDSSITEPLMQALRRTGKANLRKRIIELLAHLGDERAVPELARHVLPQSPLSHLTLTARLEGKERRNLSIWCAWALGEIRSPDAGITLQQTLNEQVFEVRSAAMGALRKIVHPAACEIARTVVRFAQREEAAFKEELDRSPRFLRPAGLRFVERQLGWLRQMHVHGLMTLTSDPDPVPIALQHLEVPNPDWTRGPALHLIADRKVAATRAALERVVSSDPNETQRNCAALALAAVHPESPHAAPPAMISNLLITGDVTVAIFAARLAPVIASIDARRELRELIKDRQRMQTKPNLHGWALLGLTLLGDPDARSIALEGIAAEERAVRWTATALLGESQDPQAADQLTGLLADSYLEVRIAATLALAKLGEDGRVGTIEKLLTQDPSWRIHRHARIALSVIAPEHAQALSIPDLIELAQKRIEGSVAAIWALGERRCDDPELWAALRNDTRLLFGIHVRKAEARRDRPSGA